MSDLAVRSRAASLKRKTKETEIRVQIDLDGSGQYEVETGIAFLDHMLESFARHSLFDLVIEAKGDLEVDYHHTVEDVGISLGQAFREALGNASGIQRFGYFVLPMAESKVEVAADISNRAYLAYDVELVNHQIGRFDALLVEDFFYAFCHNAGIDLHIEKRYGRNPHHVTEAVFKGVARALRGAVCIDPRETGLPTVKGTL